MVQLSSAYNFVRNYAFVFWYRNVVEHESPGGRRRKEEFHNELLSAFAQDLRRRGIALILFDGPGYLARWPGIRSEVEALDRKGLLRYLRTDRWYDGVTDYGTPEGHPWGPIGHRIVAEHLVAPLRAALAEGKSARVAR